MYLSGYTVLLNEYSLESIAVFSTGILFMMD